MLERTPLQLRRLRHPREGVVRTARQRHLVQSQRGQVGERIRGPENFIALNESYPDTWRCSVRRIGERADGVVTVTKICDGDTSLFAASFFEVRYGKFVRAGEYFTDNGPPPLDRSAFEERC